MRQLVIAALCCTLSYASLHAQVKKIKSIATAYYESADEAGLVAGQRSKWLEPTFDLFDKNGFQIESRKFNKDSMLTGVKKYEHNSDGQLLLIRGYDAHGDTVSKIIYSYNANGQVVKEIDSYPGGWGWYRVTDHTYGQDGNLLSTAYNDYRESTRTEFQYTSGKLSASTKYTKRLGQKEEMLSESIVYDEKGRVTKGDYYDEEGKLFAVSTSKYDERGNRIEVSTFRPGSGTTSVRTMEFTYDAFGNWTQQVSKVDGKATLITNRVIIYY